MLLAIFEMIFSSVKFFSNLKFLVSRLKDSYLRNLCQNGKMCCLGQMGLSFGICFGRPSRVSDDKCSHFYFFQDF